jgi:hypothetical protein
MSDLIDEAGYYRRGGVGVMEGSQVIHMAPPAARVPALMGDLFQWLAGSDAHPLITSSVFHYEFEFIHPFADGNGRMGRLRQSLVLVTHHPPRPALPPFPLVVFGPKIAPPGEAPWIRSDRPLPEIFPWSWGLVSRTTHRPGGAASNELSFCMGFLICWAISLPGCTTVDTSTSIFEKHLDNNVAQAYIVIVSKVIFRMQPQRR